MPVLPQPGQSGAASGAQTNETAHESLPVHRQLQHARQSCGLTLKDAAARTGETVLHLSNVERGKVVPTPALQRHLAELYGDPALTPAPDMPGNEGAAAPEVARLHRLEFRRHRPLDPDETVHMLDLLRRLDQATTADAPATLLSDPYSTRRTITERSGPAGQSGTDERAPQ